MGALLTLRGVERRYPSGDTEVAVLKDVNLEIQAGEMVAIVGPSGSGKSTLMNILGCLDRPSSGTYAVAGEVTSTLDDDALARLRREHFGFIFQSYHLIAHLPATANVEVPAVYSGKGRAKRHKRASEILTRLGLGDRLAHRPGQLSGGQQQRVSIARALMNGGEVILADEPTGALDSHSGEEVLRILHELHAAGHTIVLVTHDMRVAAHAQRIIEISDGRITSDRANHPAGEAPAHAPRPTAPAPAGGGMHSSWNGFVEALRMAWISMITHRLRTALTMLGLVIGISSVVTIVALGAGARAAILSQINQLGTTTVTIFPGKDFGDTNPAHLHSLRTSDVDALKQQYYTDSVSPIVATSGLLRYRDRKGNALIEGVSAEYMRVNGRKLQEGINLRPDNIEHMSQVVVIDHNAAEQLFKGKDPLGKIIMVGDMPATVIGVTAKPTGLAALGSGKDLNVWIPYTTAATRLLGEDWFNDIIVRVRKGIPSDVAQHEIEKLLTRRHGTKDFQARNSGDIAKTITKITGYIELLLALIAAISLVVGGIGVMNIMLVSVSERTREIGIRMAVGARQSDIRRQFLIEAVMVCLAGGVVGVLLAWLFGQLFALVVSQFHMIFSLEAILIAFAFSSAIGLLFGFLPARNAARLDPIVALARE